MQLFLLRLRVPQGFSGEHDCVHMWTELTGYYEKRVNPSSSLKAAYQLSVGQSVIIGGPAALILLIYFFSQRCSHIPCILQLAQSCLFCAEQFKCLSDPFETAACWATTVGNWFD